MDEILQREDVKNIIKEIKNNEKYYMKTSAESDMYYADDIALYIFYEALLKYYIIFDNLDNIGEYIYDVDLLFRKIDIIEDIRFGISKLIVKFSNKFLNLEEENRDLVVSFVFGNYITNGYLIHGFSSTYKDDIKENGFRPSEYFNYYNDFIKLNEIFKKYNEDSFIDKDFINKDIFFTDDIIDSCIYSINSPMYFCNLLTNNSIVKDKEIDYYKNDYDKCIKNFNKVIEELKFNDEDKEFALDLINKEWELLHKNKKNISLLLVRRELFDLESIDIDSIISSDLDINEAVDSILNFRYKNIPFNKDINSNDLEVVNLDIIDRDLKEEKKEIEEIKEEEKIEEKQEDKIEINDTYGMISPLLLLGSLLISLGVIVSIINMIGG